MSVVCQPECPAPDHQTTLDVTAQSATYRACSRCGHDPHAPHDPGSVGSSSTSPNRDSNQRSGYSNCRSVHESDKGAVGSVRGPYGTVARRTRLDLPSVRRTDFGEHYPDGGWGWVVCGAAFLVNFLAHGLLLSSGTLAAHVSENILHSKSQAVWLCSLCYGLSLLTAPVVTAIVQRKSTRLVAVVGSLISVLACLFLSFSTHKHQLFVCWSLFMPVGAGITTTSSSIMIGRYFLKRREVAEMLTLCGSGVGMAVMSVSFKQLTSILGWMRGLQVVCVILLPLLLSAGMFRSSALYHPRRRAILHIRNLKKSKLAQKEFENEAPYLDFSPLRMRTLQLLMLSSAFSASGTITPFILLPLVLHGEDYDSRSVTLLMVYMGVAFAFGSLLVGLVVIRSSLRCMIARQYLTQMMTMGCGVVTMLVTLATDFNAYSLYVWSYGLLCGAYFYSMKMLTYEQVTVKLAERSWGYMLLAQALPTLFGPPLSLHIYVMYGRGGFILAGLAMMLGGMCLFFLPLANKHRSNSEVIQTLHLRAKSLNRDTVLYGMDVSASDHSMRRAPYASSTDMDKVQAWTQRNARLHMVTEEEQDSLPPGSSVTRISDFLYRGRSMLESLSRAHNVDISKIHVDINIDSEGNRGRKVDSLRAQNISAIKELRLEAIVTGSDDRRHVTVPKQRRPVVENGNPQLVIQEPSSPRMSESDVTSDTASEPQYGGEDEQPGPAIDSDSYAHDDDDDDDEYDDEQQRVELCEKMTSV